MIKRVAYNFFLGYGTAAMVFSVLPERDTRVPVAVFDVRPDTVVTYHTSRVQNTAPSLFQFNGQD